MSYQRPIKVSPKTLSSAQFAQTRRPEMDIHTYLNNEIRAQGTPAESQYVGLYNQSRVDPIMADVAKPVASTVSAVEIKQRGVSDVYMQFNSLFKDNADYPNGTVVFLTAPLNSNKALENVVQIQLLPFTFPRPTWNEPIKSTAPDYLYLRRVFLNISELPSTSGYGTATGKTFQWEFNVLNPNSISVTLEPIGDTLYLDAPLGNLSQLSFRFYIGPNMDPLIIYRDSMTLRCVPELVVPPFAPRFVFNSFEEYSSVSTEYAPGAGGVLTTPVGVWFTSVTGVPAPFIDFTRPQGWFITEMTAATPSEPYGGFIVGGYFNGLTGVTLVSIQIRKNTFAIPMRFSEYQKISQTGIVPSHV